ncbi:MAG: hypothetical protein QW260_03945 [Thermoproteota archaeon]
MSESKKAKLAFAFSLTSGLLILLNSLIFFIMQVLSMFPTYPNETPETYHWHMMAEMMSYFWGKWAWFFLAVGATSGIMVLVSSLMLRSRQKENLLLGVLIIVFSSLSIFSMGGFFLGFIFGVLGGVLAMIET